MGEALYRKYRTKSLASTLGQDHITTTLANAIKSGKISHAYLLSGPRGVGKTSIARILAHEINGLPYDDEAHLDIIEIDAASNRRIDEIRDLRDRVNTAPAHAKYKVYIIDEVHMLTKEAFNALLKTLEEPPEHVVFILATTEAHKLPETIISRTQRYTLRLIPQDQVVAHLRTIADGEKITVDDNALELIALHGGGSFRDSISLLDQAGSGGGHITRDSIERILGLVPEEYVAALESAISSNNSAGTVSTLTTLYNQGFEPAMLAQQLSALIRSKLLDGRVTDPTSQLQLLEKLLDVAAARSPKQLLEIILLQSTFASSTSVQAPALPPSPIIGQPAPASSTRPLEIMPAQIVVVPKPQPTTAKEVVVTETVTPVEASAITTTEVAGELWQQVLEAIKKQYNTLYGIARMAEPSLNEQKLTLSLKFAFHQKRLSEAKNRKILSDVVYKITGQPIEIVCVVAESPKSADTTDVAAISNIFGGAELLES